MENSVVGNKGEGKGKKLDGRIRRIIDEIGVAADIKG